MNKKYWCRGSHVLLCKDIVKTGGSEEARNGRVSIRDDPDNLTFTVTLESLTLEDAGTYMCGVGTPFPYHRFWNKESFRVEVSVIPGSSLWSSTTVPETIRSSLVHTQPSVTTEDTITAPSPQP
ncbi:immunoglobulin domain-containing protein, partial [Escherichia coli]|nr:immunoglobulin domain-containing protein [Escherichia coli]